MEVFCRGATLCEAILEVKTERWNDHLALYKAGGFPLPSLLEGAAAQMVQTPSEYLVIFIVQEDLPFCPSQKQEHLSHPEP